MRTIGDSPDLGALADYLDFLDVHDLRALGVDETIAPPPMLTRTVQYAGPRATASTTTALAPTPVQYVGQPGLVRAAGPAPRLVAAMIPAGRIMTTPFGASAPSSANPGAPTLQPTSFAPMTVAPPSSMPASDSTPMRFSPYSGAAMTQGGAVDQPAADPGTPPGDPNAGASSAGGGLVDKSAFGWLAMAAGAYVMWRALK